MNREFKLTFFTSLLGVLLVVSNLIGMKLTNCFNFTISVDFITYPFTFLCTLLIMNLGSKKAAYRALLVSGLIQIFITISYMLAIRLGNQTVVPDAATHVNALFAVRELNILASVLAFAVSHSLLIYVYDSFKELKRELSGLVVGLLGSMILSSFIYIIITLNEYDPVYVVNTLLSNIIISMIMLVIIIILFYILKEKNVEVVPVISLKEANNQNDDLALEDVILKEEKKNLPKTTRKKAPSKSRQGQKKPVRKTNKSTTTRKKSNKTSSKGEGE